MSYQDHWVRGRKVQAGTRPCGERYQAIRDALTSLPRPFYVLDLGANAGYFSFRLAEDLSAFVTAADVWPELRTLTKRNRNRRVTVIPRNLALSDLPALGYFDAVLALSVLHHLPDWRDWLQRLREMTPALIVETPHPDEYLPRAENRDTLGEIFEAVQGHPVLCTSAGYDNRFQRPTVLIATGTVIPTTRKAVGVVFAGSGNATKRMRTMLPEFRRALGYQPSPGSLNLRVTERLDLGPPVARIHSPVDFQFWPATVDGIDCHVMQPGVRGHPHAAEIVAAVNLRTALRLQDGSAVTLTIRESVDRLPPFDLGVCTTAWGGYEKYLDEWARSVCAQTYRPIAVTIVATLGASQRARLDALFSQAQIPWRAVDVPAGLDMGALRNLAVQHTDTEWVMHLDADDLLHPWCVADCAALAPEADVVSIGYTWDGVGRKRPRVRLHKAPSVKLALAGHLVSHSPSPFRRKLWEERPYLTGDLVDTALWIGFAHLGARFVGTDRPCFIYRGHADSHSNTITPERRREAKAQLDRLRAAQ